MQAIKVKYGSGFWNKDFIIYTDNNEFQRIHKGIHGFNLIEDKLPFMETEEVVIDEIKGGFPVSC